MRVALTVAFVVGISAAASAQSAEVLFHARVEKGVPRLDATVIDAPRVPASKIELHVAGDPSGPAIHPRSVRTFAEGDEPIAIVIVLNGQEIFIGNDDFETDDNARYLGVLDTLKHGLDALHFDRMGPPGSTIAVVSYSTGARVLVPAMPLDKFRGDLLGSQRDFRNHIGTDMVDGITVGLRELDATDAPHKLLLVVGDGNDTNNDTAKSQLGELQRHARRSNIEVGGIIYKTVVSAEGQVLSQLDPGTHVVNAIPGVVDAIAERMSRVTDRYYLSFADDRLPWDGKPHDVLLTLDHHDLDQVAVVMPDHREHTPWWRRSWGQLLIGLALVGLLIAGVRLSNGRISRI